MASDKFPEFTSSENVPYFDIPADEFKNMITQTIFALSDDETRYFMNGVFFEKNDDDLTLVSTDGRRLAYISKPLCQGVSTFSSAIVPPKILNIILKRAPSEGFVSLAIVEKMIFVKFGSYQFTSVLIDGQFPNYRRVIPESQLYNFKVEKADLQNALKRVGLLVDKKSPRIYLDVKPGRLTITSQETEIGTAKEEIPENYISVKQLSTEYNINMTYAYDLAKELLEQEKAKYIGSGKGILYVDRNAVEEYIKTSQKQSIINWED